MTHIINVDIYILVHSLLGFPTIVFTISTWSKEQLIKEDAEEWIQAEQNKQK